MAFSDFDRKSIPGPPKETEEKPDEQEELSQEWLLAPMKQLKLYPDIGGVCFGISCVSALYMLMKRQDILLNKVDIIKKLPPEKIPAFIDLYHTTIKNKKTTGLSLDEEKEMDLLLWNTFSKAYPDISFPKTKLLDTLDLLSFMNTIALYAEPDRYFYFNLQALPADQDLIQQSKVLLPAPLADKPLYLLGERNAYNIYSFEQLKISIADLEKTIKASGFDGPVVIFVDSLGHSTVAGLFIYAHNNLCMYIDPNTVDDSDVKKTLPTEKLAEQVFSAFADDETHKIMISYTVITASKDHEKVQKLSEIIKKFQQDELKIDKLKAQEVSTSGHSLLYAAIKKNDKALLAKLLTEGAKVNIQIASGDTPLMTAVLENNIDMVNLLLEQKADPNLYHFIESPYSKELDENVYPLHYAILYQNYPMCFALLANMASPLITMPKHLLESVYDQYGYVDEKKSEQLIISAKKKESVSMVSAIKTGLATTQANLKKLGLDLKQALLDVKSFKVGSFTHTFITEKIQKIELESTKLKSVLIHEQQNEKLFTAAAEMWIKLDLPKDEKMIDKDKGPLYALKKELYLDGLQEYKRTGALEHFNKKFNIFEAVLGLKEDRVKAINHYLLLIRVTPTLEQIEAGLKTYFPEKDIEVKKISPRRT